MPVVNFKEIPEAHIAGGKQDTFEYFARDFLKAIGFKILTSPSRGRDEGMDLIIVEERHGVVGKTDIKWLVSCKHKAHSGRTVTPQDEKNIQTRVSEHECEGFMGFYSVGLSSGLSKSTKELEKNIFIEFFDNEKIEAKLIEMAYTKPDLFKRYFPTSFDRYITEYPKPVQIYGGNSTISCSYCGKDLLAPRVTGLLAMCYGPMIEKERKVFDIYFSCHGDCDKKCRKNFVTSWASLSDFTNPKLYIKSLTECMFDLGRGSAGGEVYTEESLQKLIVALRILFSYVSRKPTNDETARANDIISYGL